MSKDFELAVEAIKPYLPKYLEERGIIVNKKKKIKCLNPNHQDDTPSCNLVGDEKSPRLYCHGCSSSYDIFDVVQILENKPRTGVGWIEDTLKYLANKYSVDIKLDSLSEEQIYQLDVYRAYRAAAGLIQSTSKEANKLFQEEIKRRGWVPEALDHFSIGTVTSFHDFRESLLAMGFTSNFLDEVDLSRADIFNENNIIFIWKDEKDKIIGFTSRDITFETKKAEGLSDLKKYNNTRSNDLKFNIFKKGERLYGVNQAVSSKKDFWYIFEGQADVTTAWCNGLNNCVAIAGSALRDEHIHLLKDLGIHNIVLCLDGDKTGFTKTQEILEKKLAGNRDFGVRVIELPDNHDPDSFIREKGIKAFRELAHWSAFEWRLNQYPEEDDPADICRQMIPFIVNEFSPVKREQLCKSLSKRTGVGIKPIIDELNILLDERSHRKSRERQDVLERMSLALRKHPTEAETILQSSLSNLFELSKKHDADNLSNEDFVRTLEEQKKKEEITELKTDGGFELGSDLKELSECLRGSWSEGVFMCFGGKPNVGKSALLSKIAYEIASNNEDVCVIYHTIDDTAEQLTPRFVTIAENSRQLSINMVRQPNYWIPLAGEWVSQKRSDGYHKLKILAEEGRLVIKDLRHGGTLAFAENLICYFQEKFPSKRIVYILDNFHKLRDFQEDAKDERVRFKKLSEHMKGISIRKRCCVMATVEYTKMASGIRPTNNNVAESAQIEYDASFLAHVYSEVADLPDSCTVLHKKQDWKGENIILPRIEVIIGKNKITEQKKSFFLDFWPASSDFGYIDQETVIMDSAKIKEEKKRQYKNSNNKEDSNKSSDEMFGGLG